MDQDDPQVTGEEAGNLPGSQPEVTTPESSGDDNPQGASAANPEEVAWNQLKGNTQDRFKQILREKDEAAQRAERLDSYVRTQGSNNNQPQNQPIVNQPNFNTPEVQNARKVLSDIGFPTEDRVDEKINQGLGQIIYNFELQKLEDRYDGSDGVTPKFDRAEYQDFINRNPKYQAYDPEDVFKDHMYPEEIRDAQKNTSSSRGQSQTSSLKPTKTVVREEQWSPDWIESRMKQSDGMEWYAKNKEKINNFLAKTAQE